MLLGARVRHPEVCLEIVDEGRSGHVRLAVSNLSAAMLPRVAISTHHVDDTRWFARGLSLWRRPYGEDRAHDFFAILIDPSEVDWRQLARDVFGGLCVLHFRAFYRDIAIVVLYEN